MQFRKYWRRQCKLSIDSINTIQLYEWFGKQSLEEIFSYIFTLTKNPVNNSCRLLFAERAFLKLTRINNKYSSSQTQENLDVQIVFYLENDLLN